jgi:hypothetical protein
MGNIARPSARTVLNGPVSGVQKGSKMPCEEKHDHNSGRGNPFICEGPDKTYYTRKKIFAFRFLEEFSRFFK